MSVVVVAKKDFQDAVRSRSLWALSAAFLLFAVLTAYGYAEYPDVFATGGAPGAEAPTPTMLGLAFFLGGTVSLFVSLTAIVIAYKAIAGEIELGSIKLLLALPHSRRDVVFGKIVGRSAVLALPALLGLAVGLFVGGFLIGALPGTNLLLFLLVTGLFVLTYVSVVVGLSAATRTTTRASVLAIGFFVVFEILWDIVPVVVVWAANGFELPQTFPDWVYIVSRVPPSSAYNSGLAAVLPESAQGGGVGLPGNFDAFYATPWLGFVVLAFWLVVPAILGYLRFDVSDL